MNQTVHKACNICRGERIRLGGNFLKVSKFRRIFGTLLIYLPLIFVPFVVLTVCLTWVSLKIIGARKLKSFGDFAPEWKSHRYRYKSQIVQSTGAFKPQLGWRWFWIFNCNLYCPLSVALFEYTAYLVKAVENWWCPFDHSRKANYSSAAIDLSYWHIKPGEAEKLHRDDRDNPIWNEYADRAQ
ncbi:MAG: hypothetical protein ACRESZ_06445 [Methylococcales bacterium]